ncbi:MAG: IS200/IS605 family transposase [Ignavibacterium album]|uniref:IS200/IS605 family transposase n=1 Tax=Ignavibacterium album TaxID=591197 RepID=UPI0026EE73C6|nr:IS200/IS605 family transposase [Ignavibacterium album]MBI5661049.1 IS200/IS605 family transposase [Ignavibacterium album]
MSLHSYSKCWLHIIFGTLNKEKILHKEARVKLSEYFYEYSKEKNIYMKINYVNADHTHLLIDLPTSLSIEEVLQLYKGSSSNWINKSDLLNTKFSWGRGYGVFSVSESAVGRVCEYISNQGEHHRVKSFTEEYKEFITKYGMKYIDD